MFICVLHRLLKRPIDSMGRARLLENMSAGPICSRICRVDMTGVECMGRPNYTTSKKRAAIAKVILIYLTPRYIKTGLTVRNKQGLLTIIANNFSVSCIVNITNFR